MSIVHFFDNPIYLLSPFRLPPVLLPFSVRWHRPLQYISVSSHDDYYRCGIYMYSRHRCPDSVRLHTHTGSALNQLMHTSMLLTTVLVFTAYVSLASSETLPLTSRPGCSAIILITSPLCTTRRHVRIARTFTTVDICKV